MRHWEELAIVGLLIGGFDDFPYEFPYNVRDELEEEHPPVGRRAELLEP